MSAEIFDDGYTYYSAALFEHTNFTGGSYGEVTATNITSGGPVSDDDASFGTAHHITNGPYDIELFDEQVYCINRDFDNVTYLNVSCETDLAYSVPLYGYCSPFLLFTTVLANTLIVMVLNKRNMATPTNMVLMGKIILGNILLHYII